LHPNRNTRDARRLGDRCAQSWIPRVPLGTTWLDIAYQ